MTDLQKGGAFSMRPVALLGQGLKSAGLAAGMAAAVVLGVGILALALNWIMLLLVLPGEGLFSFGALMLIFGVAFPIAWLVAAQPIRAQSGRSCGSASAGPVLERSRRRFERDRDRPQCGSLRPWRTASNRSLPEARRSGSGQSGPPTCSPTSWCS